MLSFIYLVARDSLDEAVNNQCLARKRVLTFMYHGSLWGHLRNAYHIFGATNEPYNYFERGTFEEAFPEGGQLYIVEDRAWIPVTLQELRKRIFLINLEDNNENNRST